MSQLALFESPPPVARRDSRDIAFEKAFSAPVQDGLLAVALARPDEWLDYADFRQSVDDGIGSYIGHVLGHMARKGLLVEKHIYLGRGLDADRPGSSNYQGFKCVWMLAPPTGEQQ